jgi:redox-sensitive bicupin YhaK (pirin superfamily)
MINIRPSAERGHNDFGWLNTHYTFSFNNYFDHRFTGFSDLRVINEDLIEAGSGFPPHSHQDMEILTYVITGSLSHKDSLGNGTTIKSEEVQKMTAGTGVTHSEFSSDAERTHLLQIWIIPNQNGLAPNYEQRLVSAEMKLNKMCLIASGSDEGEAIKINQDTQIFATVLEEGKVVDYQMKPERRAWIQIISGQISVNGVSLKAGDGAGIISEELIRIKSANKNSEFLFFDLR